MPEIVEPINIQLRRHQVSVSDWQYRAALEDLHTWAERLILEFKLQTTTPAIMVEDLRGGVRGHHRRGRNGLGLRHEIVIGKDHLRTDEHWQVIGTLAHELLHAEQENVGKPGRRNYHNKQLRERAKGFGLIVDERGYQQYAQAPTAFLSLLDRFGVKTPALPPTTYLVRSKGNSKLKPWICGCKPRPIHVQVAVQDFQAQCLKCGRIFIRKV